MKNYIDEIYTVEQFIQDNPLLPNKRNGQKTILKAIAKIMMT